MARRTKSIKGKYIVWFGLPVAALIVFALTQYVVYMTKAHPPNTVESASIVPLDQSEISEPAESSYAGSAWKLPLNAEGWSEFPLAPEANVVYVSSSSGSDRNLGREDAPVRSLRRGMELLHRNSGDRLLLKRGDTWEEVFGSWTKSGASAESPLVVGAYGSGPRPRIVTGEDVGLGIQTQRAPAVKFLVLRELDFVSGRSGPDRPGSGIGCLGELDHMLIEDCRFSGYSVNVVFQVHDGRGISNITIRRSIIVDSNSSKSHSQGLFCKEVAGLTIEECVFDHNGWSEIHPEAVQTMFNHNVYIQTGGRDVVFRDNISSRASSHGVQARCGGLVAGNFFFECPLAVLFGGGQKPIPGPISGRISNNVMLNGNDIAAAPRGNAIEVNNLDAASTTVIADNVAAHVQSKRDGFAIILDSLPGVDDYAGIHSVVSRNNTVYNWGVPLRLVGTNFSKTFVANNRFGVYNEKSALVEFHLAEWTTPDKVRFIGNRYASNVSKKRMWFAGLPPDKKGAWREGFEEWAEAVGETGDVTDLVYTDPTRDLAQYNKSIGGEASAKAFLDAARNREAGMWPKELTAGAVNAFIREGFKPKSN